MHNCKKEGCHHPDNVSQSNCSGCVGTKEELCHCGHPKDRHHENFYKETNLPEPCYSCDCQDFHLNSQQNREENRVDGMGASELDLIKEKSYAIGYGEGYSAGYAANNQPKLTASKITHVNPNCKCGCQGTEEESQSLICPREGRCKLHGFSHYKPDNRTTDEWLKSNL